MNIADIEKRAYQEFQAALQEAFWRRVRTWLGKGCNDLLSFQEVFAHLIKRPQFKRGSQNIPLDSIVGSTGRYNDFDLAYSPRKKILGDRWSHVARVKYQEGKLPPVLLYKVGYVYFVEDGNHRVSVTRFNREAFIQANVIEFDVSNLISEPSCTRLGYKI